MQLFHVRFRIMSRCIRLILFRSRLIWLKCLCLHAKRVYFDCACHRNILWIECYFYTQCYFIRLHVNEYCRDYHIEFTSIPTPIQFPLFPTIWNLKQLVTVLKPTTPYKQFSLEIYHWKANLAGILCYIMILQMLKAYEAIRSKFKKFNETCDFKVSSFKIYQAQACIIICTIFRFSAPLQWSHHGSRSIMMNDYFQWFNLAVSFKMTAIFDFQLASPPYIVSGEASYHISCLV